MSRTDFKTVLRIDLKTVQTEKSGLSKLMASGCGLIRGGLRPGLGLRCGWFHSLFIDSLVDSLSRVLGLFEDQMLN